MVQRSFLERSTTIAFAHRGGGGEAPENTLPAFEAAVALGYRYLETDVHVTGDGVLLAFHDSSLERLTDRVGRIGALSLAEVRAADAGYAFSPDGGRTFPFRATGVMVPTLEELLTRWDDVYLNIDAKADDTVAPLGRAGQPPQRVRSRVHRIVLGPPGRAHPGARPGRTDLLVDGPGGDGAMAFMQLRGRAGCPVSTPTACRCRSDGACSGSTDAS